MLAKHWPNMSPHIIKKTWNEGVGVSHGEVTIHFFQVPNMYHNSIVDRHYQVVVHI